MNNEIAEQIRKTNKLLALLVTKDLSQVEKVVILRKVGFQPTEIADLIGVTGNAVRVALAKVRKKGKI